MQMGLWKASKVSAQLLQLHIQIPPTGYMGLILRSPVATASRSTVDGTMRVL